jgi:UDPglucose 6-dehydrogenase
VIGTETTKAEKMLRGLYSSFDCPLVSVKIETAEIIKYASNAYLATKISFINEIANICEKVGADVEDVSYAMGLDSRIGNKFLKAGIGYGGSCFPKDVRGLKNIALKNDYEFHLLKSVIKVNHRQKMFVIEKARKLIGKLEGKKICIWGLAFKPNTDDFRESLAIDIIKFLQKEGVIVNAYDPITDYEKIRKTASFGKEVKFFDDPCKALKGCDGLIVVTEWDEFRKIDLRKMKELLRKPNVIDGRNIYNPEMMAKFGFNYMSVGR